MAPIDEVWPTVVDILQTANSKNVEVDNANHTIKAGAGVSFFSWGENITVTARPYGASQTQIEGLSQSSFKLTLIDYGKNKGNVKQLVTRFQERLPVSTTA